jgi:hypothetical protein
MVLPDADVDCGFARRDAPAVIGVLDIRHPEVSKGMLCNADAAMSTRRKPAMTATGQEFLSNCSSLQLLAPPMVVEEKQPPRTIRHRPIALELLE